MRSNIIHIVALCAVLSSCEFFKIKNSEIETPDEKIPIARVHDVFLYPEDLEGIVPSGMSVEDSTDRINRYINNWAKKQLLIKEAAKNIEFDEADIDRKILDYRYSLMGYEYQSFYINKHLNKDVTDEQIAEYYKNNVDNFILKQSIIRGKFAFLPLESPKTEDMDKLILTKEEEGLEKLNAYCLSFAISFQLNDSIWMNLNEIIKGTPWSKTEDIENLIEKTTYLQTLDSINNYYINIVDHKTSGEIAPMNFVSEQIRDIIINKRKMELARELEKQVYIKATENNEIEIFKK